LATLVDRIALSGRSAWMSTMFTIVPCTFDRCGAASWEMKSGARRLEPISSSQCEASMAPSASEKARGVVHQDIQAAEAVERRGDQRPRRDRREQLRLDRERALRAQRVQLRRQPVGIGRRVPVVQQHAGARGVQASRDRGAHATRAAGDQRRLAFEEVVDRSHGSRKF